MSTPITVQFSVELDRWASESQTKIRERLSSGRTSLRVSKSTVAALRVLAERIETASRDNHKDGQHRTWGWRRPSPDQLIAAIAAGRVRHGHASPPAAAQTKKPTPAKRKKRPTKKPGRKTHASRRSTKRMPRSTRRTSRRKVRS